MSTLSLDLTGVLSNSIGKEGISPEILQETVGKLESFNKSLWESPIPFMLLPSTKPEYHEMTALALSLPKYIKNLVVLGIGGSSLGTQAIFNALLHPLHNMSRTRNDGRPRYFMLDNIDPQTINAIIHEVRQEKDDTVLVVISKSGETAETNAQFMLLRELLGPARDRTILITDANKGLLREIAVKEGYRMLHVPDGVGGRFSVLTPVGLFPSLVMGIDIDELARGAGDMAAHIRDSAPMKNMALLIAAILYLMDKSGKPMDVMMPYCDRLSFFADWFRQLLGESLGKNGKGPTPVKSMGVTDQHSQLQLFIEGPKDKCLFFLYADGDKVAIPNSFSYISDLEYLSGNSLNDLFLSEFQATTLALTKAGVPNLSLNVATIDAYSLGALFFLFEMVIPLMGKLYEVNAFDQPGVEQGKIYTKALMGKEGYEEERRRVEDLLAAPREIVSF